ncbi:MAG: hypothetical protein WDW38_010285 [Sanguina aurantia]
MENSAPCLAYGRHNDKSGCGLRVVAWSSVRWGSSKKSLFQVCESSVAPQALKSMDDRWGKMGGEEARHEGAGDEAGAQAADAGGEGGGQSARCSSSRKEGSELVTYRSSATRFGRSSRDRALQWEEAAEVRERQASLRQRVPWVGRASTRCRDPRIAGRGCAGGRLDPGLVFESFALCSGSSETGHTSFP